MSSDTESKSDNGNKISSSSTDINSLTIANSIPIDPSYRYPLHRSWVLHWNPDKVTGDWSTHVRPIPVTIDSIEVFWAVYNQFSKPSNLPNKFDLHFFLKGVKPEWEDPANKKGGKWAIEYKGGREDAEWNAAWQNTLLALIGEQFTDNDNISGCVIGPRKGRGNRLHLWTTSTQPGDVIKRIGKEWKQIIGIPTKELIGFSAHDEAAGGKNTYQQSAMYEI